MSAHRVTATTLRSCTLGLPPTPPLIVLLAQLLRGHRLALHRLLSLQLCPGPRQELPAVSHCAVQCLNVVASSVEAHAVR